MQLTGLIRVVGISTVAPIFVVFAFATGIVATAVVSTIVARVAFVASSSSFAVATIIIVSLEIVKSSGEGLKRLMKLSHLSNEVLSTIRVLRNLRLTTDSSIFPVLDGLL